MRASGEEFPVRSKEGRAGSGDPGRSTPQRRELARDARARAEESGARATPERPLPTRRKATSGRPTWPIPLALLGLLGLVLAAILGWGVAPGREQLPANLDTTREFTGTANSVLNPQALQAGDAGSALMTNVPITGQRTVRVLATSGDAARVQDDRTLMAGGQPLGTSSNTYAVDRRSLEPATNPPADWNAQPHQGLTVSFPIGAEQRDYTGWVPDSQTTTPLRFVREESRGGVVTFVYEADTSAAPIRDQAVLSTLPTSLTRAALEAMLPSLPLSAEQRSMLAQALPGLPEQVPVSYTYEGGATYWVEPTTGIIVDSQQRAIRTGTIGGPGGSVLGTMPVYSVDSRFTDGAVAAAASNANDRRDALDTVGSTWPWVLGTLGILALVAGLLGLLARRRPQPAPPPSPRPSERTTVVDTDAARRTLEARPEQPQPPYAGKTPHAGPYRAARSGQGLPPERQDEQARRGQPGQPQGGPPSDTR